MQLINITQNQFLKDLPSTISFAQQYTYGSLTIEYYRTKEKEKIMIYHPKRNIQPKEIIDIYQAFPFPIPKENLSYIYLYHQFQLTWKKLPK